MAQFALVTGADRGLGLALNTGLLERGWQVFAGQYMPDWPELGTLAGKYPLALHILPLDVSSIDSAKAAPRRLHLPCLPSRLGAFLHGWEEEPGGHPGTGGDRGVRHPDLPGTARGRGPAGAGGLPGAGVALVKGVKQ